MRSVYLYLSRLMQYIFIDFLNKIKIQRCTGNGLKMLMRMWILSLFLQREYLAVMLILAQEPCNNDSLPEATVALVYMAVAANSNWKVPCGYFLVNGATGEQKANLTKECIIKLHEEKVKVVSFTCDGPSSH